MKTPNPTALNEHGIKKLYLDACRVRSIKPRRQNFKSFTQLLENDFHYWTTANLKYFFENINH